MKQAASKILILLVLSFGTVAFAEGVYKGDVQCYKDLVAGSKYDTQVAGENLPVIVPHDVQYQGATKRGFVVFKDDTAECYVVNSVKNGDTTVSFLSPDSSGSKNSYSTFQIEMNYQEGHSIPKQGGNEIVPAIYNLKSVVGLSGYATDSNPRATKVSDSECQKMNLKNLLSAEVAKKISNREREVRASSSMPIRAESLLTALAIYKQRKLPPQLNFDYYKVGLWEFYNKDVDVGKFTGQPGTKTLGQVRSSSDIYDLSDADLLKYIKTGIPEFNSLKTEGKNSIKRDEKKVFADYDKCMSGQTENPDAQVVMAIEDARKTLKDEFPKLSDDKGSSSQQH